MTPVLQPAIFFPSVSDLPRLLLCSFDVIPSAGALSQRITEYLKGLSGHFNVVVLCAKGADQPHIEHYQGARLLRVPVGTGDWASQLTTFERAVRRQVASEDYALVHFTDPFSGYAVCEQRSAFSYRILYEALSFPSHDLRFTHQPTAQDRRLLAKIRRQELFCLMTADAVLTGSALSARHLHSLGVSEDVLRVLRAPVEMASYGGSRPTPPKNSPLRLVYVGGALAWHDLPCLLHGVALAAKQTALTLTWVGPLSKEARMALSAKALDLGLATDQLRFTGPVSHEALPAFLAESDVGIVSLDASERNRVLGAPLAKASTYMAAGLPIVAPDLPLTREVLPSLATHFFAPGNAEAMASCLVDLAQDLPSRVERGQAARAEAERNVDAQALRQQLLKIYQALLPTRAALAAPVLTKAQVPASDQELDPRLTITEPHALLPEPARKRPPPLPSGPPPEEAAPLAPEEAVEEVGPDAFAEDLTTAATSLTDLVEEAVEIDNAQIQEAEPPRAPLGKLDFWFSQVVHGYSPPEATDFARPTPPTTFPGREIRAPEALRKP